MMAEKKANLADLINSDRVRSSIRRLFQNDIAECLAELFQNSQRARASEVDLTTSEESFTYRDNGHGLIGGVEGFHTLLKIAESNFDNETIVDQDPMGLGIHALLAHDGIRQVTFASGPYKLTIDTGRWWNDREYYTNWFTQLVEIPEAVAGLEITIRGDQKLVVQLKQVLNVSTYPYRKIGPSQGYEGYLKIKLDGAEVDTSLPYWARIERPLIVSNYLGSRLTIGFSSQYGNRNSSVNWYGQVIEVDFLSNFKFHLDVRSGCPVNPLSPTRRGLIKDSAHEALISFVKDKMFSSVFDPHNQNRIRPEHVAACFRMDEERALRESPYIVAAEMQPLKNPSSLEDLDRVGDDQLFTYDAAPKLLKGA